MPERVATAPDGGGGFHLNRHLDTVEIVSDFGFEDAAFPKLTTASGSARRNFGRADLQLISSQFDAPAIIVSPPEICDFSPDCPVFGVPAWPGKISGVARRIQARNNVSVALAVRPAQIVISCSYE